MGIVVYNTLTRRKEPLVPRIPGRIGIYVCGMTVYDHCHIGHARVMVVFDTIVRFLRATGLDVTYVRNFTDIDDKIIRRAEETGVTMAELTTRFITAFHEDMDALGVARADIEPCATAHMKEMQTMIARLIDKGLAYVGEGDVYYAVDRFPGYGTLSGKTLADLAAGSRVAVDDRKRNPLDFVLWKGAKPGEPQWDSPWGAGRPGWHIECSAMSTCYLGETFDIHGGGLDLVFPHHENEIAQTEGVTGRSAVSYWLHNGFVNVVGDTGEREKMSKSLGNFLTIRDLLARYPGEVVRLFILNSHYRSPLDFSHDLLTAARAGIERIYTALQAAQNLLGSLPPIHAIEATRNATAHHATDPVGRFMAAMEDDFNTPQALAVLFDMVKELNRAVAAQDQPGTERIASLIQDLGSVLGLALQNPTQWFQANDSAATGEPTPQEIEAAIAERKAARQARNFARADQIRDDLARRGVTLLDAKDGTSWRRQHPA
ncbi:MAG: cysteine--tRNA ligase [Magnetococcales bacterium]|nr:cysteine--tRNA ligase [Magnetococcales bacterium]